MKIKNKQTQGVCHALHNGALKSIALGLLMLAAEPITSPLISSVIPGWGLVQAALNADDAAIGYVQARAIDGGQFPGLNGGNALNANLCLNTKLDLEAMQAVMRELTILDHAFAHPQTTAVITALTNGGGNITGAEYLDMIKEIEAAVVHGQFGAAVTTVFDRVAGAQAATQAAAVDTQAAAVDTQAAQVDTQAAAVDTQAAAVATQAAQQAMQGGVQGAQAAVDQAGLDTQAAQAATDAAQQATQAAQVATQAAQAATQAAAVATAASPQALALNNGGGNAAALGDDLRDLRNNFRTRLSTVNYEAGGAAARLRSVVQTAIGVELGLVGTAAETGVTVAGVDAPARAAAVRTLCTYLRTIAGAPQQVDPSAPIRDLVTALQNGTAIDPELYLNAIKALKAVTAAAAAAVAQVPDVHGVPVATVQALNTNLQARVVAVDFGNGNATELKTALKNKIEHQLTLVQAAANNGALVVAGDPDASAANVAELATYLREIGGVGGVAGIQALATALEGGAAIDPGTYLDAIRALKAAGAGARNGVQAASVAVITDDLVGKMRTITPNGGGTGLEQEMDNRINAQLAAVLFAAQNNAQVAQGSALELETFLDAAATAAGGAAAQAIAAVIANLPTAGAVGNAAVNADQYIALVDALNTAAAVNGATAQLQALNTALQAQFDLIVPAAAVGQNNAVAAALHAALDDGLTAVETDIAAGNQAAFNDDPTVTPAQRAAWTLVLGKMATAAGNAPNAAAINLLKNHGTAAIPAEDYIKAIGAVRAAAAAANAGAHLTALNTKLQRKLAAIIQNGDPTADPLALAAKNACDRELDALNAAVAARTDLGVRALPILTAYLEKFAAAGAAANANITGVVTTLTNGGAAVNGAEYLDMIKAIPAAALTFGGGGGALHQNAALAMENKVRDAMLNITPKAAGAAGGTALEDAMNTRINDQLAAVLASAQTNGQNVAGVAAADYFELREKLIAAAGGAAAFGGGGGGGAPAGISDVITQIGGANGQVGLAAVNADQYIALVSALNTAAAAAAPALKAVSKALITQTMALNLSETAAGHEVNIALKTAIEAGLTALETAARAPNGPVVANAAGVAVLKWYLPEFINNTRNLGNTDSVIARIVEAIRDNTAIITVDYVWFIHKIKLSMQTQPARPAVPNDSPGVIDGLFGDRLTIINGDDTLKAALNRVISSRTAQHLVIEEEAPPAPAPDNKDSGNKDSGNKDSGNKDSGGKKTGNKDSGNKDSGGKKTGNDESYNQVLKLMREAKRKEEDKKDIDFLNQFIIESTPSDAGSVTQTQDPVVSKKKEDLIKIKTQLERAHNGDIFSDSALAFFLKQISELENDTSQTDISAINNIKAIAENTKKDRQEKMNELVELAIKKVDDDTEKENLRVELGKKIQEGLSAEEIQLFKKQLDEKPSMKKNEILSALAISSLRKNPVDQIAVIAEQQNSVPARSSKRRTPLRSGSRKGRSRSASAKSRSSSKSKSVSAKKSRSGSAKKSRSGSAKSNINNSRKSTRSNSRDTNSSRGRPRNRTQSNDRN